MEGTVHVNSKLLKSLPRLSSLMSSAKSNSFTYALSCALTNPESLTCTVLHSSRAGQEHVSGSTPARLPAPTCAYYSACSLHLFQEAWASATGSRKQRIHALAVFALLSERQVGTMPPTSTAQPFRCVTSFSFRA